MTQVTVDANVRDYVTPSALAREGLLIEYTRVYNELDHVISIVCVIYTKCGPKCLPPQVCQLREPLLHADCRTICMHAVGGK